MVNLKESLKEFVNYYSTLKGDEKGESQVFCDRFFRAFGHGGYKEAGAILEERIKRKGKSTRFADLVWKPRMLLEMKKRNEKLENHKEQAFDYWKNLVPNRPRYVLLCNFDEFWIYDFDTQVDEPVDKILTKNLPEQYSSLNFMLPIEKTPIFGNNQVAAAREAANKVATVFNSLVKRGESPELAQRFVLQCVLAMFSEDFGLLPSGFFIEMIKQCLKGESTYDVLGGLFQQMNNPNPARGGKFKNIPYFNGGLFENVDPIELEKNEIELLYESALDDWIKVKPEVFGTLFQASMNQIERHALGAHFTSEVDIRKIVDPVLIQPWKEKIKKADSLKKLTGLRKEITEFKVLDPSCGSGNFLYIAFRELRKLELKILRKIAKDYSQDALRKIGTSLLVSPKQFYGIDINPFAVELAKVTLMIGKERSLSKDLFSDENAQLTDFDLQKLPLDNLDDNIKCEDALFSDWPEADIIISNPPYQSKNKMQEELGADYVKKVRKAFPGVPGRADYCVYWFYKSHCHLKKGGYAGLVGTNTIRQNYSREGGLDFIVNNGGEIIESVSSQVWSGDAVVHVSIANWKKGKTKGKKKLFNQNGNDTNSPWEIFELDIINSSLSPKLDVSRAKVLNTNKANKTSFQGQTHGHEGFLLDTETAKSHIQNIKKNKEVLFPYLIGNELIGNLKSQPKRFIIDFHPRSLIEASQYKTLFEIIKNTVLVKRKESLEKEKQRNEKVLKENPKAKVNKHHQNFYNQWWQLSYAREDMVKSISILKRYIVCSRVTKRQIFEFVDSRIRPSDSLQVFAFEDDYSFGILNSTMHWEWFKAKCSSLKGDYRYTTETVFNTFPWPQNPTQKDLEAVSSEAVNFRKTRQKLLKENKCSLRDLYRTVDLPGKNPLKEAQKKLDRVVKKIYNCGKENELNFLLNLNFALSDKEKNNEIITPPGLPDFIKNKRGFITTDCVKY